MVFSQETVINLQDSEAESSGPAQRILVVDDSAVVCEALKELLELNSYSVSVAHNAEHALETISKASPDLILSDIMMPGGDGWKLQQEVRNNADLCEVPFVFITAVGSEEQRRLALELGCDDYLRKPIDPRDLLSSIKGKLSSAEKRKRSALRRLQAQHRRVIHTLSHEFRTPLVSVTTGSELLLDQFQNLSVAQVKRLLQTIFEGGQRLERLVSDFMLLQQIDLGQAAWQCQRSRGRTSVVSVVESSIKSFLETIGNDRETINISLDLPPELPKSLSVDIYDVQISNVLQRLLSNAQKFGDGNPDIRVSIQVAAKSVEIVVRDFGPGFELNAHGAEVFDLFQQINREVQEQQGCGVGLTIARYLAELNGGSLNFTLPKDSTGLEARLRLPLA